jgi:caspase domain-containing protein
MEMSNVGHHYLLAAGTSNYRNFEDIDLPSVPADVGLVVNVFRRLGFIRILEDESLNSTAQRFRSALNGWLHASERSPKDRLVFYYSGHGEKSARHYLLFSDSKDKQFVETALAVESIMEMVFESPLQHAWLILDTCYSGAGIADAAALAIRVSVPQELAAVHGYYFMAAARAREYAYETTQFASVLARALRNEEGILGGKSLPFLHPDAVLGFVSEVLTKAGSQQHVTGGSADTAGLPELIPNLRYTGAVAGLTIEEQEHAQSIARRNADHAGHWLPRSLGSDTGVKASYFTGRQRLLSELESWLNREKSDGKARVIVGGPGTGKSAILGKLVVAPPGQSFAIDIALHARNKTLRDAVLEFADSVPVPEVQTLLGTAVRMSDIESAAAMWISNVEQRNRKAIIVVDALDESEEPDLIARHLLVPLSSLASVWLLVGSRPDIPAGRPGPRLRILAGASVELDLDLLEYLGPTDTADYVASLLLAEQEPDRATPYRGRIGVAHTVASAVARRACGNFLVARILAKNLMDVQSIPDVTVPDWDASLPATIGAAFDEFLARFDDPKYRDLSRQSAIDLLLPLAYSEGEGFPWENLWASTASAVSGSDYSDADVRRILAAAAAFIVESRNAAGSVYRLYHAALGSHLREAADPRIAQRRIVEALRASVPIAGDGTPRWERANVYIRSHMVAHAKVSGDLDELIVDPGFLLASDSAALFQAARFVNTSEARSAIYVYSSVLHHLQSEEPETFPSYLEMIARQNGCTSFAGRIRDRFPNRPWLVTMAAWRALSVHSALSAYPREHAISAIAIFGPPEEQRVATIGSDGWVWITEPYRGTRLASFRCATESDTYGVKVAAFCRLGEKMVVIFCDTSGRLQVWDIDRAERLYDMTVDFPDRDPPPKSVAATLVDGTPAVAVGSGYGELDMYDLRDGSEIARMSGYTIWTNMIAFVESTAPPSW